MDYYYLNYLTSDWHFTFRLFFPFAYFKALNWSNMTVKTFTFIHIFLFWCLYSCSDILSDTIIVFTNFTHSLGFITWTYRPYRPGSTLLRWAYMHSPWEQSPWEQSFSNNHGNKTANSWPRCAQALWLVPCMLRSWKFLAVLGKVTFKSNALQYCVTP